ncbi:hypothetical protein J6590_065449 [Homalodisca vitripennis]|nr:hypothetical protein J6590_065449 [Homalodisca vitripennis]
MQELRNCGSSNPTQLMKTFGMCKINKTVAMLCRCRECPTVFRRSKMAANLYVLPGLKTSV